MLFSLNEIEAQLRKAARGAGLPWGLAEEAGKAARWLAMHGIDGLPASAALFEQNDGRPYDELAPMESRASGAPAAAVYVRSSPARRSPIAPSRSRTAEWCSCLLSPGPSCSPLSLRWSRR
jgi:hypothetical protein